MTWDVMLFISIATIGLLFISRFINQLIFRVSMTDALIGRDNQAMGIQIAGYLFGVILVIATVVSGPSHGSLGTDIMWVAVYGIGGNILLAAMALVGLRLIASSSCLAQIRDGNAAAGTVAAGCFISSSLVLAGSLTGDGTGPFLPSLVFFLIGQCSLLAITFVFRLLTDYDDTTQIKDGNVAAALSYAGLAIAIGIIVRHSLIGDFVDYQSGLLSFGKALILVVALYPVRQWLVQGMLLGANYRLYGGTLDTEIGQHRNLGAAAIEGTTYIATALLTTAFV